MPRFMMLLLAGLLVVMPARAQDEPTETAMTFVGGFSDEHLAGMLQRIGARQPVLVAASQVNSEILISVFEAEIAQAVMVYGPTWQHNLALSWTPLLTDDEMLSLTNAGAQSPYTDKYLDLRPQAGKTMQSLSEDLFREILSEVVNKTVKQMGETDGAAQ